MNSQQFGWTLVCSLAIILWSSITMIPIFLFLKKIGKLRVSEEVEVKGLDIYKVNNECSAEEVLVAW